MVKDRTELVVQPVIVPIVRGNYDRRLDLEGGYVAKGRNVVREASSFLLMKNRPPLQVFNSRNE